MLKTATKAKRNRKEKSKKSKIANATQGSAGVKASRASNRNGKRPTREPLTLEELTLRSFQIAYDNYHNETA